MMIPTSKKVMIKIGLVDDHQLFLKSLGLMLETLGFYSVVVEAINGKDLQQKLTAVKELPDVMLIDVNMPVMDGIETAEWLQQQHPAMKLVALSMNDKDNAIIKMFKAGCCSYLLKDVHPAVLDKALQAVYKDGYYNGDLHAHSTARLVKNAGTQEYQNLTAKELSFLKLACSELTYKQIAAEMHVSERTVDGYRESVFHKIGVQSRVGMCLEALRREWVSL